MSFKLFITGVFSVLSSYVALALGGYDELLTALAVFVALDYITGLAKASERGEISSSKGFKGIKKKVLLFCLIVVGVVLDRITISDQPVFRTIIIMFLIGNEGFSIIENLDALGVPIPKIIREKLLNLKREDSDHDK